MLKHMFVTGTDTAVGKTVVARALLQHLAASHFTTVGYKPIAERNLMTAEGLRNHDALVLQTSSSLERPYSDVNPLLLTEAAAGCFTGAAVDYEAMSRGLRHLSALADTVVVDGNCGWRAIMNDYRPYSEWVIRERLPVVLVIGIKLGCISHAKLTAEAILNDGLPLLGWIANRINPGLAHYAEVLGVLNHIMPAPKLGDLPYLPRAEQRDLAKFIDFSPLNIVAQHTA
ncbi:ATP-dependent dethiobiotin synthetase BioD [Candidatus Sodalis endolongispinus]|uniref:ATP-dependent dethiobiotin synthetase BioD n=1 Tax=Candidatus Sodalis endolongispinus TaxID=2812662 RepID=A0ABS5YDY6_9GAMM|nr:dethiobiotin synthase [Candidatus Sodalis endolongispinus]MBT9433161.1 ATP-dependent dethiobiotin synthetase BioD [Candidatus Sodalis endolongispinus]